VGLHIAIKLTWKLPPAASRPYEFQVVESKAIVPPDAKHGEDAIIGAVGAMYSAIGGIVAADAQGRAKLQRTTSTVPTKPSLLWLMQPLFVPMPSEPIGVGARWTVKQRLSMNDVDGALERTYELTGIQGDTLAIRVSGPTRWHEKGGAGSATALVDEISGTLTVNAGDVLAQSADITITEDLDVMKSVVKLKLAP